MRIFNPPVKSNIVSQVVRKNRAIPFGRNIMTKDYGSGIEKVDIQWIVIFIHFQRIKNPCREENALMRDAE